MELVMTKDEVLKMAIEYLEAQGFSIERQAVLDACKEALEQPARGIELEWYNKGWDDALKEKNT
jgi:surface antigen